MKEEESFSADRRYVEWKGISWESAMDVWRKVKKGLALGSS